MIFQMFLRMRSDLNNRLSAETSQTYLARSMHHGWRVYRKLLIRRRIRLHRPKSAGDRRRYPPWLILRRFFQVCHPLQAMRFDTLRLENGFVYIPETAPWLADYLHEMTVFPKGKYDDQVDSTAQFLEVVQTPICRTGAFRVHADPDAAQQSPANPERHRVCLRAAHDVGSVQTFSADTSLLARIVRSRCLPMMPST
jgi:hypothetical protein